MGGGGGGGLQNHSPLKVACSQRSPYFSERTLSAVVTEQSVGERQRLQCFAHGAVGDVCALTRVLALRCHRLMWRVKRLCIVNTYMLSLGVCVLPGEAKNTTNKPALCCMSNSVCVSVS